MLRITLVVLAAIATLVMAQIIASTAPHDTAVKRAQLVGEVAHVNNHARELKLTTGEVFLLGTLDPERRAIGERVLISYDVEEHGLRARTIKRLHEQAHDQTQLKTTKSD